MQKALTLIGREPETEIIDRLLQSGRPEFLAVYGRRRVGKTFLIRQYLKSHLVFDFTGTKDGTKEQQLINFFEEYKTRTKGKKEKEFPASWEEAFRYLAGYLKSLPKTTYKRAVFIDEMPWADTPKGGFVPALEFFWNQHASNMNNVLLIACGSSSSWIKKKLIAARGGLYNRVTQRMQLMPFNLHEAEQFLNSLGIRLPRYQVLEIYMAMGGIPFYLKEAAKGKSAAQIIDSSCFTPQGLLQKEYEQLYHSLFNNANQHIAIIEALATKPQGITRTAITTKTRLSEGTLQRALEELVDCDFISIYQPFANKKKTAIYKLTDLYSLFYLKFIKSNRKGGRGTWQQLSQQSSFTAWSGYAFENICMMHLQQIKKALGIGSVFTTASSWQFIGNDALPGAQIDMIIDRADGVINLCEAKFTLESFAITKSYAAQLRIKKSVFKQATQTKKAVFTTLLTTFPAFKNQYYQSEVDNEISMDSLFRQE
ncbi:MAG: ATPase [Flavisolibacter sp.]|nr:ATPase [Flavisolibacter sp.]